VVTTPERRSGRRPDADTLLAMTTIDVTDDTFQTEVLERSETTPVVVDLWAPWCGPCRTLGPIIEKVVDETEGRVVLAKVNVDDNPQVSQAFRVQGIPAVYALSGGKVVDGFVGAQGEPAVREFVERLQPSEQDQEIERLVAKGDDLSLRQALELRPDHHDAIVKLAELLAHRREGSDADEALALLERIPETPETRRVAALVRTGGEIDVESSEAADEVTAKLDSLLDRVKGDDEARQEFVDLLEVLGADDPRTAAYRKKLTSRLF
jgi:putative thioredoxin